MTLQHFIFGVENLDVERCDAFSNDKIDNNIEVLISKIMDFESELQRYLDGTLYESAKELELLNKFYREHRSRTTSVLERKNKNTM